MGRSCCLRARATRRTSSHATPRSSRETASRISPTASEWRQADANAVGLQRQRLDSLSRAIAGGAYPGVNSLIVIRHGYLVTEQYFNGTTATTSNTLQSVTKSVTSLIAGIAVDRGHLTLASRALTVLPEYDSLARVDARKRDITLRHLLEMRSGINFYESPYEGSPLERLNTSAGDWVQIALGEPMNADPGTRWQYNSGGPITIASMVRRAANKDFATFARENLFIPIGVTSQLWYYSQFDLLPHTGGGLLLKPLDLARIGYLVLRRGKWNGARLVSEEWLTASMTPTSTRVSSYAGYPADYGLLWWLMPLDGAGATGDRDRTIWAAVGNFNNWLFIVPKHDLIVVVTGGDNRSFGAPVSFLYREILPAITLP